MGAGFTGTTQVSVAPNGGLFVINPAFNILDGKYTIPVPKGSYAVGAEATDGNPAAAANISLTAQIGSIFGQLNFAEEFYNRNEESNAEFRPGQRKNVPVKAGKTSAGIDITTNPNLNINNFGTRDSVGFTGSPPGRYYAVRIPAAQISAAAATSPDLAFHSLLFDTAVLDASVVPVFAEAYLARGSTGASSATIDLDAPLANVTGFVGQDNDFAPFYLHTGHSLARQVLKDIEDGTLTDLFLVLRLGESPFPGVSALPPLIDLDVPTAPTDPPIFGFSYISDDGGVTFAQVMTFNFRFSLGMVDLPK